jgi:hypothetical protein
VADVGTGPRSMIVGGLWRTRRYSALSRLVNISALRAADHVQQTRLAGPAHPHAHRVVTAVQRAHRWFQRDTVLRGGQRIPVGAHHDAFTATAPYSKSAVTVCSDAANPDAAISVTRPGHDLGAKPGDLGGMHLRIHPQGDRRRPPYAP